MSQSPFFATREDLILVLRTFESAAPARYMRTGHFSSETDCPVYSIATDLPILGEADSPASISCCTYLVFGPHTKIKFRTLNPLDGRKRLAVDQLMNPDTITFTPGGKWNESTILAGRTATASTSNYSKELMRRFTAAIRKHFKKIRAFHVGPHALAMFKQGYRLTDAVQSPHEYDFLPSND